MKKLLIVCCAAAFAAASMTTGAVEKKFKRKAPRKVEHLMCQLGTEDRQARIAVEMVNGAIQNFAYYSKWKPRTCSVYIVRDDAYSKWEDNGRFTKVTTEKGTFLIENTRKNVHFIFRDVERERYCGADGKINGTLTVWRGKKQCELDGMMDNDPNEMQ
jgi:Ni/Co efflux regulator RcnB